MPRNLTTLSDSEISERLRLSIDTLSTNRSGIRSIALIVRLDDDRVNFVSNMGASHTVRLLREIADGTEQAAMDSLFNEGVE